jgi:hypothetical protein
MMMPMEIMSINTATKMKGIAAWRRSFTSG